MGKGKGFLERIYSASEPKEVQAAYDAWSASYDDEISDSGYVTPQRTAKALRGYVPDPVAPILDFGCGTGLSGQALRAEDFQTIDGVDISGGMLAQAREKGTYRHLIHIEPGEIPAASLGDYAAITAIGVIGVGAAPVTVFDDLMTLLGVGGLLAFSFNDHALAEPEYEGKLMSYIDAGGARLLFKEHGAHLPGIGLGSTVYVVRKL